MGIPIITFLKKLLGKKSAQVATHNAQRVTGQTIPRHPIVQANISKNALLVCKKLQQAGFEAYIVGGSVRDLLLGKNPKDFDVSTSATPQDVKQVFRNARIIGRRFKLVHVIFNREIIEVATFRGNQAEDQQDELHKTNDRGMIVRDNLYGTQEEDTWRRDFSINALYYNPITDKLIDITNGVNDLEAGLLRIIGEPSIRYQEDPVRMLRALRFAAKLDFKIEEKTASPIKEHAFLITHISSSRLFDEMTKLFTCGSARQAFKLLEEHGFLPLFFPSFSHIKQDNIAAADFLGRALDSTDARIRANKTTTPAFLFAVLLWYPLLERVEAIKQQNHTPPLEALEQGMNEILQEQCRIIAIPKRLTLVMREIWLLQYRLSKRHGQKAFQLREHPRFRAAYDFLVLRAGVGDEEVDLAQWWTKFQECGEEEQQKMVNALPKPKSPQRRRRPRPKSSSNAPKTE